MNLAGLIWLLRLLALEPVQASIAGARLAGFPGLASELLDIAETEPPAIDVPLLSAIVTARRLGELSQRYKLRTIGARAHAWRHGVGCRCEAGRGLARCALCPPRDDAE